jgi:hypothetical protein
MVSRVALIDAFIAKLQAIPEVMAALGNRPDSVQGYYDIGAISNSSNAAIYSMNPGTVLVVWEGTETVQGEEMSAWIHRYNFYLRPPKGVSALQVMDLIVNGVPVPGDGQCWRRCPVMDGLEPTTVLPNQSREPDSEGVDYYVIQTETHETGDW